MTMLRLGMTCFLAVTLAGTTATAAQPPTPATAVEKACDAAGGLERYGSLGILKVKISSQEVMQDGTNATRTKALYVATPGPIPGRIEIQESQVIAADDSTEGHGGWAVVHGKFDSRPATKVMIQRLLRSDLFPILIPFSLTWPEVGVTDVTAAEVGGQKVWRLTVDVPQSFFHTPQIATRWTVDLDQQTFAVVRIESPATDIGKGIRADGMRFFRDTTTVVGGVGLVAKQRVIGVSMEGFEMAHSRADDLSYEILPASEAEKLFSNPIPPDQRPKLPIGQKPSGGGGSS